MNTFTSYQLDETELNWTQLKVAVVNKFRSLQFVRCEPAFKLGTHYPCPLAVPMDTSVILLRPCPRVVSTTPVFTARGHGPWTRVVCTELYFYDYTRIRVCPQHSATACGLACCCGVLRRIPYPRLSVRIRTTPHRILCERDFTHSFCQICHLSCNATSSGPTIQTTNSACTVNI